MLIFGSDRTLAQNLVPNPSFEVLDSCPSMNWNITASNWYSSRLSPDNFATCADQIGLGVPTNDFGTQYAPFHSDGASAFAGLITSFQPQFTPYREYIGCRLLDTLVPGVRYFVSFLASLAETSPLATNNLGVHLSTIEYKYYPPVYNNPAPIFNSAHIFSSTVITDTSNWTSISGSFIADSSYTWLMVGNFFDNVSTSYVSIPWGDTSYGGPYYYIDNVCLSTDSVECLLPTFLSNHSLAEIKIFPNPAKDQLKVLIPPGNAEYILYDAIGRRVLRGLLHASGTIDLTGIPHGVYTISIKCNEATILHQQLVLH